MAGSMMDMYASQIARAREIQFPTGGQRPVYSGINLTSSKPGYGDEARAVGAALSETFIKPRVESYVNQYKMENDPAVLEDRMLKALEHYAKMPDELKETIRGNRGHQELLQKFLDKVPNATSYITRRPDNTLEFMTRAKTKEEREALEVSENARTERELQRAQTRRITEGEIPLLTEQAITEKVRPEHMRAEIAHLQQGVEESKARVKKVDAETRAMEISEPFIVPGLKSEIALRNANAFNARMQGEMFTRMPDTANQLGLESFKLMQQEVKDTIKGHEMQKKQIDHDSYVTYGDNPTLEQRLEGLKRHGQDAIGIAYKLGSNNNYVRGETAEAVDGYYGAFVQSLSTKLPTVMGRQGWGYQAAKDKVSKQLREASSFGNQIYDVMGPYMPKDALQKIHYMDYVMAVREGRMKPLGWTKPSDIPDEVLMANLCKKFSITDPSTQQAIYRSWANIQTSPNAGVAAERTKVTMGGR
jgi:hypothetical protein